MRIEKIEPKDIHVLIDFPLKEVAMLVDFLNHCEMKADFEKEPHMSEASRFVEKELFPELDHMLEDLKRHGA